MARPVSKPPAKLVGVNLSLDLIEMIDEAVAERGITKRAFFEMAARREIVEPSEGAKPQLGQQEEIPLAEAG
jgi:metal-responsive CopG/Arc/MetJ family transcriptional regulator